MVCRQIGRSNGLKGVILKLSLVINCVLCDGQEVRIGLLMSVGDCCTFKSYEDKASAVNIAMDQLYEDGVLDKTNTTFK